MKLKELRENKNINQTTIADFLNISQEKYSRIENEKSKVDLNTLIKLADFFHVTIDNLVDHNVPYLLDKSLLSEKQNKLIERIINLNNLQCEKVEAYIIGLTSAEEQKERIITKFKGV